MPTWPEQSWVRNDFHQPEDWTAQRSSAGRAIGSLGALALVLSLALGSAAASASDFVEAELTANDAAAGDEFGRAVGLSGDIVVVGAPFDDDAGDSSGAAYIFERIPNSSDGWEQVKKLAADNAITGDLFGYAVAISGNTIVIGAPSSDDAGDASGVAYVFERDAGGSDNWGQVKRLEASDAAPGDWFGHAIAISQDTIIVGSRLDDDAGESSGSAYIFERDAGGIENWGQVKKLVASDSVGGDEFGFSVMIERDTIVVGAPFQGGNIGSAYVFERNFEGNESWGQVARLRARDADAGDQFGFSVSVSADTAVVGARLSTLIVGYGEVNNAGSIYFFDRNRGGDENWGQRNMRTDINPRAGDQFGFAVSILEGRAIVGSIYAGSRHSGAVRILERDRVEGDSWEFTKRLDASNRATSDQYGFDVAIGWNSVVVGAPKTDLACPRDEACDSGSIYIYAMAQTKDQQKCVNSLNQDFARVSAAYMKVISRCSRGFARSGSSANACLMASDSSVARAEEKTREHAEKRCGTHLPDFGSTDAATVNDAAARETTDLIRDIFGSDLDDNLITWADDRAAAMCQEAAMKVVSQCQQAKLKAFNRCKKAGLRNNVVRDSADLEACVGDDPTGSVARICDAVIGRLAVRVIPRNCSGKGVDLSSAFPGCATSDAEDLAGCVEEVVDCRVCRALNQADDLAVECDLFDDGEANASCP